MRLGPIVSGISLGHVNHPIVVGISLGHAYPAVRHRTVMVMPGATNWGTIQACGRAAISP